MIESGRARERHRSKWLTILLAASMFAVLSVPGAAWAADPPQWAPPSYISEAGLATVTPQITSLPDGTLIAVWENTTDPDWLIQSSRSTDLGYTWSTPVTISLPDADSHFPQITVAADASVIVTWERTEGPLWSPVYPVQVARSTDGITWSVPRTLVTANGAPRPQIAASPDGGVHVIWRSDALVQISKSPDNGITWGVPETLSAIARSTLSIPQIAAAGDGSVTAVWEVGTNPYQVQASNLVSGVWSAPVTLSPIGHTADLAVQWPQLAAAPDGTIAAAWMNFDGTRYRVQSSTLSGGSWTPATTLYNEALSAQLPEIAVGDSNNMAAVWTATNGANQLIRAAYFDGSAWSAPVILSGVGRHATAPQIAFSPDGRATAVWQRSNDSFRPVVQSSYTDDGVTWSVPANLSAPTVSAQLPQLAVTPASEVVAIWYLLGGGPSIVQSTFPMTAPGITSGAPTVPTVGESYSFQVTASGHPPPAFAVSAGSLPAGLAMSSAGLITGTPTSASSATFTVTATNGAAPDASASYTLTPLLAPSITSAAPPAGTVTQPYSFQLTADGNPAPTFAISSGSLPAGLSMTAAGLISGTPTTVGNATFTVTAANGVGTDDSRVYTLAMAAGPSTPTDPGSGPATGTGTSSPTANGSSLPVTGASFLPLINVGLVALGLGVVMLGTARLRRQRS